MTKKQKSAELKAKAAAKEAAQLAILEYLESYVHVIGTPACEDEMPETVTGDQTVLNSISYEECPAWCIVLSERQNWESECKLAEFPCSFVAHFEFFLVDESDEVKSFFRAAGFEF
jgi:hypothetical protein